MDDIIKTVESLVKPDLLIACATETVKHEEKKTTTTRRWFSLCYDGTYGCLIDSMYGFFIDTTCVFFFDKCYI